jgi:hypothetical protein
MIVDIGAGGGALCVPPTHPERLFGLRGDTPRAPRQWAGRPLHPCSINWVPGDSVRHLYALRDSKLLDPTQ